MKRILIGPLAFCLGACASASSTNPTAREGDPMLVIRVLVDVQPAHEEAFVQYLNQESKELEGKNGCERFAVFKAAGQSHQYLLYEEWATKAQFDAYKASEAFGKSMATLGPMMAGPPDSAYFSAEVLPAN